MSFLETLGNIASIAAPVVGGIVGGPIGAGIGAAASGLSKSMSQTSSNKTYLQGVRETNETNLALAKQQNDWNLDMYERSKADNLEQWNRENEYNDPSHQMQRMLDAGVNPMVAMASITNSGSTGYSTTPLQSAELANQQAPSQTPVVDNSANVLSAMQIQAQIANLYADTAGKKVEVQKKEKEVDILTSDAKFRDALNQGTLDMNHSIIITQQSQREINYENISKIRKECNVLDQQSSNLIASLDQIKANTQLLNENTKARYIENMFSPQRLKAEIHKLYSDISKNEADILLSQENIKAIQELVKGYVIENGIRAYNLQLAEGSVLIQEKQATGIDLQNQALQYQIDHQDLSYGIEQVSKIVTTGATVLGAGALLKKAIGTAGKAVNGFGTVISPFMDPTSTYNNSSWTNPTLSQ